MAADPRETIRGILRGPWVDEAVREFRRPRRDFKGRRQPFLVRLPDPLAEQLRDVAARAGLSLSETLAVIVWAYLHRSEPRV